MKSPQLAKGLKQHAGDLTVVINGPEEWRVFAGLAIYNALVNHNGNVTVRVDGLAASIASVIAMSVTRLSCRQAHDHDLTVRPFIGWYGGRHVRKPKTF